MSRPSTIVISDWLANCRTEQWTPFEAATALKAALEREGYAIAAKFAGHDDLVVALENARRDLLLLRSRSDTASRRNKQIEAAAERAREAIAKASP